jgi:hypothetical protein
VKVDAFQKINENRGVLEINECGWLHVHHSLIMPHRLRGWRFSPSSACGIRFPHKALTVGFWLSSAWTLRLPRRRFPSRNRKLSKRLRLIGVPATSRVRARLLRGLVPRVVVQFPRALASRFRPRGGDQYAYVRFMCSSVTIPSTGR